MSEIEKPILSKITVGRVYNLGNYEHIRFDLTFDVPDGANPLDVLKAAVKAIAILKPLKTPTEVAYAEGKLKMNAASLSTYDLEHLSEYKATVKRHEELVARHNASLKLFESLGGITTFKDAKANWEDEDDYDSYDEGRF